MSAIICHPTSEILATLSQDDILLLSEVAANPIFRHILQQYHQNYKNQLLEINESLSDSEFKQHYSRLNDAQLIINEIQTLISEVMHRYQTEVRQSHL